MSSRSSSLAQYLVGCAARKAPPGLAARLEEEWLADLTARQGAFAQIRFALGCCWATRVIAREFGTAAAAAAGSSASGQRVLVGYGSPGLSGFSRRTTAIIAIVALHVGIFYLYLTDFGQGSVLPPIPRMTGVVVDKTITHFRPPPLASPRFAPRIFDDDPLPIPTFKIPAAPTVITAIPTPHPTGLARLPPQPVNRVLGGPGAGFPNTEDFYPPEARRMGEEGTSVISVCIDPRGRLTAAPSIVTSSGIGRIDAGALRLATAGSGHYRPTTENGTPVSSCYAFRITFRLADQ